jgi:hypothetical protein
VTPRIALAVAGLAALVLPLPGLTVLGVGLTAFGLVCLAGSLTRPGSAAPALLVATAALSWLATPLDAGGDGRWPRLAALALAVAAVHSAAALAAVVPVTAVVPARLGLRWAGWTTVAAAAGVATVALTDLVAGRAATAPVLPTAVALALLAATLVAVLAAAVLRRRPGQD